MIEEEDCSNVIYDETKPLISNEKTLTEPERFLSTGWAEKEAILLRSKWVSQSVRRLSICCGILFLIHMIPASVIGPYIVATFKGTNFHVGVAFFVFYATTLCSTLFSGWIGPKYGFDKIIFWYIVLSAVGYIVCSFASLYWAFAVGLGVAGLSGAPPIGLGHIGLVSGSESDEAVMGYTGTFEIAMTMAFIVAPPLGGILFSFAMFDAPFYASIAIAIPTAVYCFVMLYGDYDTFRAQHNDNAPRDQVLLLRLTWTWKDIAMWTQVGFICLISVIYNGMLALILAFWVLENSRLYNANVVVSAVQIALAGVCNVIGVIGVVRSCSVNKYLMIMSSFLMQMIIWLIFIFYRSMNAGWFVLAGTGFARAWIGPVAPALMIEVTTREAMGWANALFSACSNVGFCIFPILYALSGTDFATFSVLTFAIALFLMVGLFMVYVLVPREKPLVELKDEYWE